VDCTKAVFIQRRSGPGNSAIAGLSDIVRQFDLAGDYDSADVFGTGHIHDTFLLSSSTARAGQRYILQRLNRNVFKDPDVLMSNVVRVLEHIQNKIDRQDGRNDDRCLSLVKTRSGDSFYKDDAGDCWRIYDFVEGAETANRVESSGQAFEAAAAFGRFQAMLVDFPDPPLQEVIKDFHNTPVRFQQFEESLQRDAENRARLCQPEIAVARELAESAGELVSLQESGAAPLRVVHSDTKINNVMFDKATGKAVCVIDLDTVMPGLSLYDFGDLVRTACGSAGEDERDSSKISVRLDIFAALVDGYLSTAGSILNAAELANLHRCGRVITAETGVRFLTDFLDGDRYFRVSKLYQNLIRCRAQFALVASLDKHERAMKDIVVTAVKKAGLAADLPRA